MKLQHLFAAFPGIPDNTLTQTEVTGLFHDARQVVPQSVFVAIRGNVRDGHQFIPDAIRAGAVALVVESREPIPPDFTGFVLQVPQTREALDKLASRFSQDPGQELFCIGVTGTNGKTSITYMIEHILNSAGIPTGVIGTINHHLRGKVWPTEMTTPDPLSVQKRLREFRDEGARAVALEVTSHALHQHRIDSVPFNAVIFTNLTRDHLDYHKTMEEYFKAKQMLFTNLMWKSEKRPSFAIINIDDKYGRRLKVAEHVTLWTYGKKGADLCFEVLQTDFVATQFSLNTPQGEVKVHLPMSGQHNVQNATAAIGAALAAGVPLAQCVKALKDFEGVPGRLQIVPHTGKLSVFVDYAHTPDALENVLSSLQQVRENIRSPGKIWTVFGCGGDRDQGKRPLMAQVALKYSDQVIMTSDNPRTEDPQKIIEDMYAGVPESEKNRVRRQVDRKQAIQEALKQAQPGDVVLIAGKGHEDYQIIGTTKIPFSDFKVAQEGLELL